MTDNFSDLDQLDGDIADAWDALTHARMAYRRSPNGERLAFRDMAERTVDELLELRHELAEAERIVRA